jgi:hypothetical protein
VHAVQVTEVTGDVIVLVGDVPAVSGESLVLDVHGPDARASLPVCVESSRAVVIDGTVRHEIRVTIADGASHRFDRSRDRADDETPR